MKRLSGITELNLLVNGERRGRADLKVRAYGLRPAFPP